MKLAIAAVVSTAALSYLIAALFGTAALYNEADQARVTI
jgi:hypothetical protein